MLMPYSQPDSPGSVEGVRPITRPDTTIEVDLVEQIVLRAFNLPLQSLRERRRGRAAVARARQVAIYLLHVQLGFSLTASARAFGRDRTTAAHACQRVEDSRESRQFDRLLTEIETALARWVAGVRGTERCGGEDVLQ